MRRFFCLVLILSLENPLHGVCRADELRPIQEGSQQTGLKQELLQAGAEEGKIEAYLDPKIENGRLADGIKPFRILTLVNHFWKDAKVKEARRIVFSNIPTYHEHKTMLFSIGGRAYGTTRRSKEKVSLRLLVEVDRELRRPIAAYDMATAEQVYPVQNRIQVYLDEEIRDGRLVSESNPFDTISRQVKASFWSRPEVEKSQRVIFSNISTHNRPGLVVFSISGKAYSRPYPNKRKKPQKLLVEVDRESRRPMAAYDMATGEQVYPGEDEVHAYLDPQIEEGKLVQGQLPYKTYLAGHMQHIWKDEKIRQAKQVALDNYRAVNSKGMAVFRVRKRSYVISLRFRSDLRLLVVMDQEAGEPVAAYDQKDGQMVYPAKARIDVFFDPEINGGRLIGDPKPVRTVRLIPSSFWKQAIAAEAKTVVLRNVATYQAHGGGAFFELGFRKRFPIRRRFDPTKVLSLLVSVDAYTRVPIAAYDMETGEQVFEKNDMILAFSDPEIKNGHLDGNPIPFWMGKQIGGLVWKEKASIIALAPVSTYNLSGSGQKKGTAIFSIQGIFRTSRQFDPENPLQLLVVADTETRTPLQAYDLKTGEQVYPAPQQPADERLSVLADLAEEGTQAGAEERWVEAYLDPKIETGRLVKPGKPLWVGHTIGKTFWNSVEVQNSKVVALKGVSTYSVDGRMLFHIRNKSYSTGLPFDEDHPPRLLVLVHPKTWVAMEAFDVKTGGKVYSSSDRIDAYLDPQIANGRLLGNPVPFHSTRRTIPGWFWSQPRVRRARTVVLTHVPVHEFKGFAGFSIAGHRGFRISKPFDPKAPISLMVLVDSKKREPISAFDLATGEQVYPTPEQIRIHLDPVIKDGRLAENPIPFGVWEKIPPRIWNHPKVKKARVIGLANVPLWGKDRARGVGFQVAGASYLLNMRAGPPYPTHLFVLVDPETTTPTEAYDLETGEQVYEAPKEEPIGVYLDPRIVNGRLTKRQEPFQTVWVVRNSVWEAASAQGAETVAFSNITTSNMQGQLRFRLMDHGYLIKRSFDAENPWKLLVVADPGSRTPLFAYRLDTGEQVYTAENSVRVYLDASIEDGRIAGEPPAYRTVDSIRPALWGKSEVRNASSVVLANYPTFLSAGKRFFSLRGKRYPVPLQEDAEKPIRVLILLDPKKADIPPVAAYDSASGEQVYPAADLIRAYLDPVVEKGRLTGKEEPYRIFGHPSVAFWKEPAVRRATRVVLAPVSTHRSKAHGKGKAMFSLGAKSYRTNRQFDPSKPLQLLVVADPASHAPIAAYNTATGEQVYPVPQQAADERLEALADLAEDQAGAEEKGKISIYLDPKIENGRLSGKAEPFYRLSKLFGRHWKKLRARKAKTIVLSNYPTQRRENSATFYLRKKLYFTSLLFDGRKHPRLLVVLDAGNLRPLYAYDQATGDVVYSVEDLVRVYLNPTIENGKIVGNPAPFKQVQIINQSVLEHPKVEAAQVVAFSNYPTSRKEDLAAFSFRSRLYSTTKAYDPGRPLRLLVLLDPEDQLPTAAFDMRTGKQVYERTAARRAIDVYIDPRIVKGKLSGNPEKLRTLSRISEQFWNSEEVRRSRQVVLANMPVLQEEEGDSNPYYFSLAHRYYPLEIPSGSPVPSRLLVLMDPQQRKPVTAYNMDTGKEVFSIEDWIELYVDGSAEPVTRVPGRSSLWDRPEVQGARRAVFSNYPTFHRSGQVAFSVAQDVYGTTLEYDPDHPVRLRVEADPQRRVVLAAYEMKSGRQVYPGENWISIYLDPPLRRGRLIGKPVLYRAYSKGIPESIWDDAEVRESKRVVLAFVETRNLNGRRGFPFQGEIYLTDRSAAKHPLLRLLVEIDSQSRRPVAAHDAETGKQVYPGPGQIKIYLDPPMENGRLQETPLLFKAIPHVLDSKFWDIPEVQAAKRVVFLDYPSRNHKGILEFSFARQPYTMSRRLKKGQSFRLLLVVDPKTQEVESAFDAETGEQVYPGKDWYKVYLNPALEGGQLAGNPSPFRTLNTLTDKKLWDLAEVQQAETIAIQDVPTYDQGGRASFALGRKTYRAVSLPFDADDPPKLLAVVDPKSKEVIAAYVMGSGKQVYPPDRTMEIYLDPNIERGKLAGDPEPFQATHRLSSGIWKAPEIRSAGTVAIKNLRTVHHLGFASFHVGGASYTTSRLFEKENPLILLLVIDPRNKQPQAGYDVSTGEQVYDSTDLVRIYLDAQVVGGKIAGNPPVHELLGHVPSSFWKEAEVLRSESIILDNVPTFGQNGRTRFSLKRKPYPTTQPFDPEHPPRLLVVMSGKNQAPLQAYERETGKKVYDVADQIGIYLNPVLARGKISSNDVPVLYVSKKNRKFWEDPRIQEASSIGLGNVISHYHASLHSFSLSGRTYSTGLRSAERLKLLVIADPKSRAPIAAYDEATGKQVYPAPQQPADERLGTLVDLAGEPDQAGTEEAAGRVVRRWKAEGSADAVVLSSSLLNQPYAEGLKTALRNLSPELAGRVYLAGNWEGLKEANRHLNVISNGSADDVAVAVGQQMPAPEKVWLIGEFTPVYGWMLRQMGMDPEEITAGVDLEEFLAQLGILLGVPQAQVQSGVEELRRSEAAVEGQA